MVTRQGTGVSRLVQNGYLMNPYTFNLRSTCHVLANVVTLVLPSRCYLIPLSTLTADIHSLFRSSAFGVYEKYIDCISFHFSVYPVVMRPL